SSWSTSPSTGAPLPRSHDPPNALDIRRPDLTSRAWAKDEAAALRGKLKEATDSFLKPAGGISAERLAEIEPQLAPLMADAERRSVSRKAPQAMLDLLSAAEFGVARVRPVWDGLPIPAQREILRLLFDDIRVGKPVHTLTRWSTDRDRLAAATARMSATWRKPGTPVGGGRAGARRGGARGRGGPATRVGRGGGGGGGTGPPGLAGQGGHGGRGPPRWGGGPGSGVFGPPPLPRGPRGDPASVRGSGMTRL